MKDKFYILKAAVDTEETGPVYPAVQSYDDYDFKGVRSIHKLSSHVIPDFEPDFRFKLVKGAKFADLLSQGTSNSSGLLVSVRFMNLINDFKVIPFIPFKVPISNSSDQVVYYWLHFTWIEWYRYVDWAESTFRLFENGKFTPIEVNSYDNYITEVQKSKYFRIAPDKVKLNSIDYDLFIHPFEGQFKTSLKLAHALRKAAYTGIELSETPLV